jgi:uncharacterized membrane-anchored protein YitT (DUF2179 family)
MNDRLGGVVPPASATTERDGRPAPAAVEPVRHGRFEDAAALVIGAFLISWGVVLLHSVNGLSGGVAGAAFLVDYVSDVPLGVAFFLFNLPFYWLAVRRLGWEFAIKTFISVGLIAVLSSVMTQLVTVQMPLFLATGFSGLSLGLGFIVLFRHRGSGGGFGILAFYLQERFGWRAGVVQLVGDLVILVASLWVVPPVVLLASAIGVAVLSITIAMNHRPGRYSGC